MMATFQFVCFARTQLAGGQMLIRGQIPWRTFGKGGIGSKVAQFSFFYAGGVAAFSAIGFTGTMDSISPHLALPGVLQRGQAADSS